MNKKQTQWLPLCQGLLCLLLCCLLFLLAVSVVSTDFEARWLSETLSITYLTWFPFAILAALALGVLLLLGSGQSAFPGPARWAQRAFGVLCLLGALALLLIRLYDGPLLQQASSPWPRFPGGYRLLLGILPQFVWLLLAVAAFCWMLPLRRRLRKAGRVFCWAVLLACGLYCLLSLSSSLLPLLTADTATEVMLACTRGTFRMLLTSAAWLIPLAMVLRFGAPLEQPDASPPAYDPTGGFMFWALLVVLANALMMLSQGWSMEYFSFRNLLGSIGFQLSYALLLRGRRRGFWLLLGLSLVSVALNFLITGPLGLMGLVNPLVCWLLLRKSWSTLQ